MATLETSVGTAEVYFRELSDTMKNAMVSGVKAEAVVRVGDLLEISSLKVFKDEDGVQVLGFPSDSLSELWKANSGRHGRMAFQQAKVGRTLREEIRKGVIEAYEAGADVMARDGLDMMNEAGKVRPFEAAEPRQQGQGRWQPNAGIPRGRFTPVVGGNVPQFR